MYLKLFKDKTMDMFLLDLLEASSTSHYKRMIFRDFLKYSKFLFNIISEERVERTPGIFSDWIFLYCWQISTQNYGERKT